MSVFDDPALFTEFQRSSNSCSESDGESELDADDQDSILRECREENVQLRKENEELRRLVRIITQPENIKIRDSHKDGPVAQLLLFNNNYNGRLQVEGLKSVLQQFVAGRQGHQPDDSHTLLPQHSSIQYPSFPVKDFKKKKESKRTNRAFQVTRSLQIYDQNFYLDQIGEPVQEKSSNNFVLPEYDRAHLDPLDGESGPADDEPKNFNKLSRMCFNCGMKDHQVKDCPSPRDYHSINQRRQKFMDHVSNSPQAGGARYHADKEIDESDPRFAKFKPGIISEDLRAALGLGRRDLPHYIYQMRMHGYPPGHFLEAKLSPSGLNLYNGDKSQTDGSDVDINEGFVDVDKIIDYPGFNTEPPKHFRDNYRELNAMPMDKSHSKEVVTSFYKHRNELLRRKLNQGEEQGSAKRRRLNNQSPASGPREDDNNEVDMEIGGESPENLVVNADDELKKPLFEDSPQLQKNETEEGEVEEGEIDDDLPTNGPEAEEDNQDVQEDEENGLHLSGMDAGSLSEEELRVMRGKILQRLQEESLKNRENTEEVIEISSDPEQPVIVVSSGEEDGSEAPLHEEDVHKEAHHQEQCESIDLTNVEVGNEASVKHLDSVNDCYKDSPSSPDEPQINYTKVDKLRNESEQPFKSPETNLETLEYHNHGQSGNISQCLDQALCDSPAEFIPKEEEQTSPNHISAEVQNTLSPHNDLEDTQFESESPQVKEEPSEGSPVTDSSFSAEGGKTLPHRSKFAKGMSQFDAYYVETSSRGVYKKLRGLLKNSPIQAKKT